MDTSSKQPKSLYDSSAAEIAYKNFLVGFMRGLGGFFITLLTWATLYYISVHYLLPQLTGVLNEAKTMIQSVERVQNGANNLMVPRSTSTGTSESGSGGIVIPPEMVKQFQQLQKQ